MGFSSYAPQSEAMVPTRLFGRVEAEADAGATEPAERSNTGSLPAVAKNHHRDRLAGGGSRVRAAARRRAARVPADAVSAGLNDGAQHGAISKGA
jgi:hypothetical protein